MNRLGVMVVEDSVVIRELLRELISADPRLDVVAVADSAEAALALLDRVRPDVITMDIRLPGMNGFEATRRIMRDKPTPIVVISSSVMAEDLNICMNALQAGALWVLEKPRGGARADFRAIGRRICNQLVAMSQVKVIRQHRAWPDAGPTAASRAPLPPGAPGRFRMLGIAASTGGPNALMVLLGGLGPDFPLPVVLVQHITGAFLDGFATWLGGVTPFRVTIVRHREIPLPGVVYLAPADHHLLVEADGLRVDRGAPHCRQRPSGTTLFRSMARSQGDRALGVLLTGMGEDGAEGLLEISRSGGYTIAEDETTAVVYGMPAAAVRLGAACESLPLPAIAPRLRELVTGAPARPTSGEMP